MKAIILVAGYATRMYPLTENLPKALLQLRGKAILDYIVEQLNAIPDVENIYVVSNSKFYPHFCEWAKTANTEIPIDVLDDGTTDNENRRGAVGDVQFAITEKSINDELVIIAGDNYFTYDLREQLDVFRKTGCDTLAGKELHNIEQLKAFAVAELDPNGKVLDLVEKPAEPKSNMAIYATYFYTKETAAMFAQYLNEGNNSDLIGAFPQWLHKRKDVYVYKMNGDCFDIGTIETYTKLQLATEDI
ncbi:MAG: nucleotidyltransferase family protein [Defluviitaleaceae bacterium]|nr:nucleotidyltransferase family protein [Defluviitaleaceae bacterium]